MADWFGSWFGVQGAAGSDGRVMRLLLTDGDLSVSWVSDSGMELYQDGWSMQSAMFKGGGIYSNNALANGQLLRHAVFDNVTDTFRFAIYFGSGNDLMRQFDTLEELLKRRAPGYFLPGQNGGRYTNPVWLERQLDGESYISYYLVNGGDVQKPQTITSPVTVLSQVSTSVNVTVNRQPFVLGAAPGSVQKQASIYALQAWNYSRAWAEETTEPTGQVFSFVELSNGDIYAGGESEILFYDDSANTWAAVATSPVTLAEDVTAAILLSNGDILFGGNGRIIKLSGGTFSIETTLPSGQVYSIIRATNGELFAADDGQILKRDTGGTWSVHNSTVPSGQVYSLIQARNGRLFAGEVGRILRTSTVETGSTSIYSLTSGNDDAEEHDGDMDLTSNDLDLFRAVGDFSAMRYTINDIPQGASINSAYIKFTAQETQTSGTPTGLIYAEDTDNASSIGTSDDYLTNRTATTAQVAWSSVGNWVAGQTYNSPDISSVIQEIVDRGGWAANNHLLLLVKGTAGGQRSAHSYNGSSGSAPQLVVTWSQPIAATDTWEVASTLPSGNVRSIVEAGGRLLFGDNTQIIASDDGSTFASIKTGLTGEIRAMITAGGGIVYAAGNGDIYKSSDSGANWSTDSTTPTAYGNAMLYSADGIVRSGDNGRILQLGATEFSLGQEATTENAVMVANCHKEANVTNILRDDAGVYTELFPASSYPLQLFPSSTAVNDAVLFGCDTSLSDSGPLLNLVFDIATAASSTTSYTITWKYWNGSTWAAATVKDGTNQFANVGVSVVCWELPSNLATTAVNGVTAYWLKAQLTALTGTFTPPTQQNRDVYSAVTPYIELDINQPRGTIDSLARLRLTNRSDGTPDLYSNRVLGGSKPVTNFEDFRAFLNFADEQNPSGVTVDVGADTEGATSFVANLGAATGRAVFFDGSASTADLLSDRVKITLSTSIASSYHGSYHVIVRGKQTGGAAGDITLRIKATSGSGGAAKYTERKSTVSTTDHEMIEFRTIIRLPVSSQFAVGEVGDETAITLQIASAGSADFYAYDIFLQPVDGVWFDCLDASNSSTSMIGENTRLTIDGIGVPAQPARSKVEATATGLVKATYDTTVNGEFRVLNKVAQRIWVLSAQTASAGSNVWLSKPEVVHSGLLWLTDRWLTGRGLT